MSDGPQVVPSEHQFQALPQAEHLAPSLHSHHVSDALIESQNPYENQKRARHATICGVQRRYFWMFCVVIVLSIAAIVGASVGGSLAVQRAGYYYMLNQCPKVSKRLCLPDRRSKPNPTIARTDPSPSATTNPQATPTNSSNSGTATDTAPYTALPIAQVRTIDATCPGDVLNYNDQLPGLSRQYVYSCQNGTNYGDLPDLVSFTAYTLQQCVEACSQYNEMKLGTKCAVAVINSAVENLRTSKMGNGANCTLPGPALECEHQTDIWLIASRLAKGDQSHPEIAE